jgi:hypothetical protein
MTGIMAHRSVIMIARRMRNEIGSIGHPLQSWNLFPAASE